MRNSSRFAVVLLVGLAGCNEPSSPPIDDADAWLQRELGWAEHADPAVQAAQDRVQKNYHFLSVCSLGCAVVGISEVTARMCYPTVNVVMADKTTEAVQSERHTELKKKARAFAESYNRLMADHLKADGIGECPPPVDWDKANTDIVALLDEVYTGGFRGDVYAHDQRRSFQIRLPRGVSPPDVSRRLCEIIARNGLSGRAALDVKSVDKQEDYVRLAC